MTESQPALKQALIDRKTINVIYLASFLTAFHFALTIYIESSFIKDVLQLFSFSNTDQLVSLVYSTAAIITFIIFVNIGKLLRRYGNFAVSFSFIFVEILSLFGLATLQSPIILTSFFIVHLILVSIIFFSLDIFLESFSDDESTGSIRGIFLTVMSTAGLLAPFLGGLMLTNGDFWKLFYASAFLIIPVLLFIYIRFRNFKDPVYDDVSLLTGIKQIWAKKDIYKIMIANFILKLFYVWMVIYTPIYLHQNMGIDFQSIVGVIIPVALLPFIMFDFIIGRLADTKMGEKEILSIGFVIAAVATGAISFITSSNIFVWASVLFATRVGASFIEVMTETYFFKKIDATDAHLIGFFRNLRPLAYILGPLFAAGLMFFIELQYIFIVLAAILLFGLRYSLTIKDTL